MSETSLPLAQKYRPKTLQELKENACYITLKELLKQPGVMPHLIFEGPPGTGKTTAARIIARTIHGKLNCFNYLELNASSERGIDVIRDTVIKFMKTSFGVSSQQIKYRIILLDEADSLTSDAQTALKNALETYATTCRIIFSCNKLGKIIDPIVSRCKVVTFEPYTQNVIFQKLQKVNQTEEYGITETNLKQLASSCKGDLRKAYTSLPYANETAPVSQYDLVSLLVNKPANACDIIVHRQRQLSYHGLQFVRKAAQELATKKQKENWKQQLSELARLEYILLLGGDPLLQFCAYLSS